jgi:hypothetical protein
MIEWLVSVSWNMCGRKWSQTNLTYYPHICLKSTDKIHKKSRGSQSLVQGLNPRHPEYKARVLTTQLQSLVTVIEERNFVWYAYDDVILYI